MPRISVSFQTHIVIYQLDHTCGGMGVRVQVLLQMDSLAREFSKCIFA